MFFCDIATPAEDARFGILGAEIENAFSRMLGGSLNHGYSSRMIDDDQFSPAETKQRMEKALRRALTKPHKPNDSFVGKTTKTDSKVSRKVKRRRAKPKSA